MKIQLPDESIVSIEEAIKRTDIYPKPVLMALLDGRDKKKKNDRKKPRFGVTRLTGKCLRKGYYELTEEIPLSLEKLWIFSRGHAIHEFFQQHMKDDEKEIFKTLEFGIFDVIGFIDGLQDNILYEFKTTANIPNAPSEEHILQAQAYYSMLAPEDQENVKKILIVYFTLSNIKQFEVPKRNIQPYLEARGTVLAQALKSAEPPKREESWLCNYCEYYDICFGKAPTTHKPQQTKPEDGEEVKEILEKSKIKPIDKPDNLEQGQNQLQKYL